MHEYALWKKKSTDLTVDYNRCLLSTKFELNTYFTLQAEYTFVATEIEELWSLEKKAVRLLAAALSVPAGGIQNRSSLRDRRWWYDHTTTGNE